MLDVLQPGVPLPTRPKPPAPLLPVALAMIVGIVADGLFVFSTRLSCLLVIGATATWFLRRTNLRATLIAVLLASAGLGMLRHAVADRWLADDHVVLFTDDQPILAHLRGRILSAPRVIEPDPDVPRAYPIGPKTRFVLAATQIAGEDGPTTVSGRVAVVVKDALLSVDVGDEIEMTGWLYRPRGPQNPGAYDWALHQRRSGLLVGLSCKYAESVIVCRKAGGGGWRGLLSRVRSRLRGYLLDDAFEEGDPGAGVISAMVLGQRSAVSRAMNEAFVQTGNAHFLAASGMHVGWLAAMGWGFMRLLGIHCRTAAVFVGLLILSYVLLAEPRPSILRAGIVGILWSLSMLVRGRTNVLNWLACAAVVILLIAPTDLFRPAFQLSFLAVLALVYFHPAVAGVIADQLGMTRWPKLAWFFDRTAYAVTLTNPDPPGASEMRRVWRGGMYWLVQLALLAFSAWFITAPLACYHFNTFTPWGWLGTLTLWFIALPVTWLGFMTVLLGAVLPSSGSVLGPLLGWGTDLMVGWVELLACLPLTKVDGRSPSALWLIAVYAVIGLWVYRRGWMPWRHGYKVAAVVLVLAWLVPPRWLRADGDALQVWMLAVGNGTGTVIELPNGQVLVYDLGTRSNLDAGRVAADLLTHRGIGRLDAIFVSHPNLDHFSGIQTLAKEFEIGRVVLNDQFERFATRGTSGWHFLEAMRRVGVPIEVTSGHHVLADTGDVLVEAIWPPPVAEQMAPDENESSTVLRLSYQGRSILLTGDIAEFGMGHLLAAGISHADVLALPHHGSVVHNTGSFIDAVGPAIAVRSAGQPARLTTNDIETLVGDRRYFNTADVGCVLVRIQGGDLSVEELGH